MRSKRLKTFFQTLKEGWSKKYITQNVLSISVLVTSVSLFWFMLIISSKMKYISIPKAFRINPLATSYILILCIAYLVYAIFISLKNIQKAKQLSSNLYYLSLWNSVDKFFQEAGGAFFQPFVGISVFIRKKVIQSQVGEVILSSILWMVIEYLYKILIVIPVIYLCK